MNELLSDFHPAQPTAPWRARFWPAGLDPIATLLLAAGFVVLLMPLFWNWRMRELADGIQGHEPAVFAVSAFLLFRMRDRLVALAYAPSRVAGNVLIVLGLAAYVAGRAYDLRLAMLALIVVVAALLLRYRGWAAVRAAWFPILFPLFALPLPLEFVLAVTGPMKTAVSSVATEMLSWAGYPVGRAGVVMTIGQYQLLVTEACAGLQTMFTLEAMGLLYTSLVNHNSVLRNALLTVLVVPIALAANVVRVVVLALVTYYLGDAAGQGFLHDFSGIVLFMVALVLVVLTDNLLGRYRWARSRAR